MSEKKIEIVEITSEGIGEEKHPFNNPDDLKGAKHLIVGTFPPHRFGVETRVVNQDESVLTTSEYGDEVFWFYGSKDNEMWGKNGKDGLLQSALRCENDVLDNKQARIDFCKDKHIAFLDLFQKINRYGESASDSHIFPIEIVNLTHYLRQYKNIENVFFTSEWVMKIATDEYKRINKEYLETLRGEGYRIKKASNQLLEVNYVIGKVFVVNDKHEVKFYGLPSPSNSARGSFETKLSKWQDAFKNAGLIK